MNCWYKLNIDNSFALRPELCDTDSARKFLQFEENIQLDRRIIYKEDLTKIVTQDWLDYMNRINLDIICCLIFFRAPNSTRPSAHKDCDSAQIDNPISINWTIGGDDCPMIWYSNPSIPGEEKVLALHPSIDLYYTFYPENKLVEVDRHVIADTPTLVRTDLIHNIHVGNSTRISFSFRTKQRFNTWEDQLAHVQHLII